MLAATWITAIATAILAVLAVVTAWYARKAFRKQSEEVQAIERQVNDAQEQARQQAELLKVQSSQLELQRRQTADTTAALELTREQTAEARRVAEVQIEDLRASIKERARHQRLAEREQADTVDFEMTETRMPSYSPEDTEGFGVPTGTRVHMAVVINNSRRPIERVACVAGPETPPELIATYFHQAVMVGHLVKSPPLAEFPDGEWVLVNPIPKAWASRVQPGEAYGFVFEIRSEIALLYGEKARFTDDAGLHWEINRDQHLERLENRPDW